MVEIVSFSEVGTGIVVFLGTTDGTVGFKILSSGQTFLGTGVVGQGHLRLVVGTLVVLGTPVVLCIVLIVVPTDKTSGT